MNAIQDIKEPELATSTNYHVDLLSRIVRGTLLKIKGGLIKWSPKFFWSCDTVFRGQYFEEEISLLPSLCSKSKISIDIGANYGGYLHFLSPHSRSCIGFEPIPELTEILRCGFHNKNVEIISCALSNHSGLTSFRHALYHPGYSTMEPKNDLHGKIRHAENLSYPEVVVKPLDFFQLENVGFIKIDVEGHEIEVLRGAQNTIQRNRPTLLIEIENRHRHNATEMVINDLAHLEYMGYFYRNQKLEPIKNFDPTTHQNEKHPDCYVRNFIFMPNEERNPLCL
jgi:FkbM family methyltransferase